MVLHVRQAAGCAQAAEDRSGVVLALLDVGLVERVDAQNGARDGGCDFPAEKLATQVELIAQCERRDRLPGLLQSLDARVVWVVGQADVEEEAVLTVGIRQAERLTLNGDEALATLTGALGQQLLNPVAERLDSGREDQRDLVTAGAAELAEHPTQPGPGVLCDRHTGVAGVHHVDRALKQCCHVDAEQGARYQSEVGEGRVTAADVGRRLEEPAELMLECQLLQWRAGVRDRRELAAGRARGDF